MAEWKYVDSSNFTRTAPLYKCRFHMGNVPAGTPKFESTEGCFVELPNINMDLKSPADYNTAEYGWPRHHKFNMAYNGGRYTNGSTTEVAIGLLPSGGSIGLDVYELEFPQTLYWGGVSDRNDPGTTPIYVNGDLIEVYGDFHTFSPDKSTIKFEQTGGTDTITVSADSNWTATTTDDWYTMDVTTGTTGDTIITFTANDASAVKLSGSVHFEDADGFEFDITVKQKGIQLGQPLHLGDLEVPTLFLGEETVVMAYLGEQQVYSSGPFIGLKVKPASLNFSLTSTEKTLKIKSSEEWTITTDADWLSFSQTSGGTGETIVTVTSTAEEETAATITVTTTSFSASVDASYDSIHYVNGIHITTPAWAIPNRIDTGILGTEDTEVTIEYVATSVTEQTDRLAGYHDGDPGCAGDGNDFRVFYAVGGEALLDVEYDRTYTGHYYRTEGETYKLTFGNNFLYDELNEEYACLGSSHTMHDFTNIFVDVGTISLKSLSIKQNNVVVFDGRAAEVGGNIGLYDSVSGQLVYNPNLDMTYDE